MGGVRPARGRLSGPNVGISAARGELALPQAPRSRRVNRPGANVAPGDGCRVLGGWHLGKSPRPAAVIHPALVLSLQAGFCRRKRLPFSGFYPRKRGCSTQGRGRGLSPVSPPREPQPPVPLPAGAAGPRRGWRLRSSRWGKERVRSRSFAAVPLFPGRKKKKKTKTKRKRDWADHPKGTGGDGSPGPRGEGGLGSLPVAWSKAPGGSVGDAAGGRMAKGEWWKRHSPRFTFFKRLYIVRHVVPTRPRC